MDINTSIEDWRDNGYDFQQGIKLLSLVDTGHHWEKYKGVGFAPFSEKGTLKKALLKFETEGEPIKIEVPRKSTAAVSKKVLGPASEELPESIVLIKQKCKTLHKAHELAHAEMRLATNPKRRYTFAKQIMEKILPELTRNYDMIREWEATGLEPPTAEMDIIKQNTAKCKQIFSSLNPRISKLRGLIKKAESIDMKNKYQQELEEKELLVDQLKQQVGW